MAVYAMLAAFVGCTGSGTDASGGRFSDIRVDGSSSVFVISEAVAEEFHKANPGVRVTVGPSGTGGGFQKFCRGETDLNDASRPISQDEVRACAANGVTFVELPIAYDGIAIVANPKASWIREPGPALEPIKGFMAGPGASLVRPWRRFRNV
jgi:phosphate transport system substrate-binding protein